MWTSRVRRDTAWRTVTTAWSVGVPIKWPQITCSTVCPVPTSTTACQCAWSFTASGQGSIPGRMPVDTGVGCAFAGGVEAGGLLLPLSPPKSRLQAETSIVNTSTSPVHLHRQSGFFNAHVCISFLPQNHLNHLPSCSLFYRTNQRTPEPDTRLSAASSGSAIPPVQLGHEQVHHCCKRSFPALAGKAPDAGVSSPETGSALRGEARSGDHGATSPR